MQVLPESLCYCFENQFRVVGGDGSNKDENRKTSEKVIKITEARDIVGSDQKGGYGSGEK